MLRQAMAMPGALTGVRVVDFGQYVAGPLAAMLLADEGADVIHIDPPGGPRWETPANAVWNRGKRCLSLDLKGQRDRAVALELVHSADVVIENFRPGVTARLGLDDATVRPQNQALVYCSLPGFASSDPRADVRGWEGVVSAGSGVYVPRGGGKQRAYTSLPVASTFAAFLAATGIAASLLAREQNGLGQHIEVPLHDAMYTAIGYLGLRFHDRPAPSPALGLPWRGVYRCSDGRWLDLQAVTQRSVDSVAKAAGLSGWREAGFVDLRRLAVDRELAADATQQLRAVFETRSAADWEERLIPAGAAAAVCLTSEEWLRNEHAREANLVDIIDPAYGLMRQPGAAVQLLGTPGGVSPRSLLPGRSRELHWNDERAEVPAPSGVGSTLGVGALDGVRVLDLCVVLAGPTAGRTLAEFGADVIKIDQPNREGGIRAHHDVNRGKRSILLDLAVPQGTELFWQLVERADVLLQNFRPGVAEKLGIDYEAVRQRRPDIVYVTIDTYGAGGPWSGRRGWDPTAAASSGMQTRYGGDGAPAVQPFALNDYGTGIMGAFGASLALRHRRRTGEGQHVRAALVLTAGMLQSRFLYDFPGRKWDEVTGQDAVGEAPLQRLYRTSDSWLFLGASEDDIRRLVEVPGLNGIGNVSEHELAEWLEVRFAEESVSAWLARLNEAGIAAAESVDFRAAMDASRAAERGLSITREHADGGRVTTTGPAPVLSRTPVRPGRPAPPPGSDAASVLADVGREQDLDELVRLGALVLQPPA